MLDRASAYDRFVVRNGAFYFVWPKNVWVLNEPEATPLAAWQVGIVVGHTSRATSVRVERARKFAPPS